MPTESITIGQRLWDEITKALSLNMTHRLLPVIREAYGKEYPPDTPIQLLSTVHSTYLNNPSQKLSSKLMDISVLVGEADYYHIESQMDNDHHMVIRMVAYDLHFAIQHSTGEDTATGEIILRFPNSLVIYPEQNSAIPDKLQCRLVFSDGSQHIYQIPTMRIQTYSLEDIGRKHLDFFIPFTLLHFRPRLDSETNILAAEELTDFVERLIVILQTEVETGILTQLECNDYINLLNKASAHIFHKYPAYHEEVLKVTEPLIKLPSVELRELKEAIEQSKEDLAQTKEDLIQTKEDLTQTKENLTQTKENLTQTKEDLIQTKEDLIQTKKNLIQTKENLIQTKEDLTQTKEDLTQTKEDLTQTKEDLTQTKEDLTQTKEDLTQTKKNLIQTKEDLTQTKEDLVQAKEDLAQTKENLVQAEKNLAQKDAYIKELEQKLAALQC